MGIGEGCTRIKDTKYHEGGVAKPAANHLSRGQGHGAVARGLHIHIDKITFQVRYTMHRGIDGVLKV